jgi:hypothetical protein
MFAEEVIICGVLHTLRTAYYIAWRLESLPGADAT